MLHVLSSTLIMFLVNLQRHLLGVRRSSTFFRLSLFLPLSHIKVSTEIHLKLPPHQKSIEKTGMMFFSMHVLFLNQKWSFKQLALKSALRSFFFSFDQSVILTMSEISHRCTKFKFEKLNFWIQFDTFWQSDFKENSKKYEWMFFIFDQWAACLILII